MPRNKICKCNNDITDPNIFEFDIEASKITLRCPRCTGLVSCWNGSSTEKKIMSFKHTWSDDERLALR